MMHVSANVCVYDERVHRNADAFMHAQGGSSNYRDQQALHVRGPYLCQYDVTSCLSATQAALCQVHFIQFNHLFPGAVVVIIGQATPLAQLQRQLWVEAARLGSTSRLQGLSSILPAARALDTCTAVAHVKAERSLTANRFDG